MNQKASTRSERDESNEAVVLIADGGEDQEDEEAEASAEDESQSPEEEGNESSGSEQAEAGGETGDEQSSGEGEADILELELEGLFVDLLGLEIDLDEVELDITAVSGENNLLGNLLDAVAGLLDGGIGGLPSIDLSGKLDDGMEAVSDALGDWVGKVFDELEAPLQELMTQLIKGVIEQLLDRTDSNGQQAATAEA